MRNIAFLAAAAAVVLSGCSKNEVTGVANLGDNVDRIGISTGVGVSRGADMVGSSLTGNDIVLSYIDDDDTSDILTFKYSTADGDWADNEAGTSWSDLTLPAVFYSFSDETGDIAIASGYTAAAATLNESYNVENEDPEQHKDLLFMTESVGAVPAGGKVYSTFRHALSKVDLVAQPGTNYVVANYVAFKNLLSSGVASVKADHVAPTITWTAGADICKYESLNRKVTLDATADPKVLAAGAIISNDGKTGSATANMKVIPQIVEADYSALQAAIVAHQGDRLYENADYSEFKYIEVLYRMKASATGARVVGYEDAASHPDFKNWDQAKKDQYSGKPLYVRAAFVLSTETEFKPSSYYKLNLNFNTFGGLLMDDCYYDQHGDRTDIDIVSDIETGDPIIPSSSTVIGITVVVGEWTPESDTDMQ